MNFRQKIQKAAEHNNSYLCVGLDPDLNKIPAFFKNEKMPLYMFNRQIIEATAKHVCAYKPQLAYYSGQDALGELHATMEFIKKKYPHIPIILDAKRGDIGATAKFYAREVFDLFGADAVTVNPYMGADSLAPFLEYKNKGIIILCRTSNPGGADFQHHTLDGVPLYLSLAKKAQEQWNTNDNVSLVVGATCPEEMRQIRNVAPTLPFLVPGIGAQGGDLKSVIKNARQDKWPGLIINSARAIIYKSTGLDFDDQAQIAAKELQDQINNELKK